MRCSERLRSSLLGNVRSASLALLTGVVAVAEAQASTALQIDAPTEVVGDGAAKVAIRVTLSPHGAGDADALKVDVSAGRVLARKELEPGLIEVTVVPPRIVEGIVWTIQVASRRGQRGKTEIRLLPAIPKATLLTSNGPFNLRVPEHLILGQDQEAVLNFRATSVSPVTLYASAGTIAAPQRDGKDRYRAVYRPPADKLPRVVLIVAVSEDGATVDWAPIRLFGRPLVSATSEPFATVSARVAGEEFGPVQADRRGHVEFRVLAPPGVPQAQTVARDALGNARTAQLKLGVTTVHEAFALCPAASESLYFFAVDAAGHPRTGIDVSVDSTLGALSPPERTASGYYTASLALPTDVTLGHEISMHAQILGEKDSRVACETQVVGEAPTRVELSTSPGPWVVSNQGTLQIRARTSFSGLRKPRVVPLLVTTDFGESPMFYARSTELYEAEWKPPTVLNGSSKATLSVRTLSPRPVQDTISIELRPGPPTRCQLTAQSTRLKANGRSETLLTARVFDAYGNPVDVAPHAIDPEHRISEFSAKELGVFTATYQAPQSAMRGHDDVVVGVGATSAVGKLRIELEPTSNRFRLWGTVGYSTNFAMVHAPIGALGVGARLPVLHDGLVVGMELGYFASHSTALDASDRETVAMDAKVVPIHVRASYEWSWSRLTPYLGVGAGVGIVQLSTSSPSAGSAGHWRAYPIAMGMAGTRVRFGPGSVLVEAAYRYLRVSQSTATGNVGGLSGSAGYLHEF